MLLDTLTLTNNQSDHDKVFTREYLIQNSLPQRKVLTEMSHPKGRRFLTNTVNMGLTAERRNDLYHQLIDHFCRFFATALLRQIMFE